MQVKHTCTMRRGTQRVTTMVFLDFATRLQEKKSILLFIFYCCCARWRRMQSACKANANFTHLNFPYFRFSLHAGLILIIAAVQHFAKRRKCDSASALGNSFCSAAGRELSFFINYKSAGIGCRVVNHFASKQRKGKQEWIRKVGGGHHCIHRIKDAGNYRHQFECK